jgi:hypothetical protein
MSPTRKLTGRRIAPPRRNEAAPDDLIGPDRRKQEQYRRFRLAVIRLALPKLEFPLWHLEDSLSALAICHLAKYQIETEPLTI